MHMVALQKMYVFSQRKEYREGQAFDISDEREAQSLISMKKAQRVEKPKHVDLPKFEKSEETGEAPGEPKRRGRPPKYLRRDMTAMDGQTGEEISLPSSPQEHPPEEQTSDASEAEQEF